MPNKYAPSVFRMVQLASVTRFSNFWKRVKSRYLPYALNKFFGFKVNQHFFLVAVAHSISGGWGPGSIFQLAVDNKVEKFYTIDFIVITFLQFITRFPAFFSEAVTVYKVAGIVAPAVTRKMIFLYIQVNHTRRKKFHPSRIVLKSIFQVMKKRYLDKNKFGIRKAML